MPQIKKTRTTIYTIKQVAMDFFTFNERFREIRQRSENKGFKCYACNKPFKDGEKISLIFTDRGNKMVCHTCGENFKKELEVL
jgi:transcription elongation factor Elf1